MNRTKRPVKGQSVPRRNRALERPSPIARHGTVEAGAEGRRGVLTEYREENPTVEGGQVPGRNVHCLTHGGRGRTEALIVRSFVIDETPTGATSRAASARQVYCSY